MRCCFLCSEKTAYNGASHSALHWKNHYLCRNFYMMLKIGVLGAGHLGKIHLKCIQQIPSYEPVGFFDPDERTAKSVMEELHVRAFHSIDALIDAVDVVDIVTPTVQHFNCAATALRKRKHVFIEKPIVATPDEAFSASAISL